MNFKTDPNTNFGRIDKLSVEEAADEAAALREGIAHHDYLYYVKDRPEISDAVYDKLFRRLQALEEAFTELRSADSPTQRVGAEPVDGLAEVRHAAPMLSLNAVLEADEVERFDRFVSRETGQESVRYSLEPKLDGLSVELLYEDGRFAYGATRGNGEVGEDISHNVRAVPAVPLRLRGPTPPGRLAVRGEVYMSRRGFTELNKARVERGAEPFANPRNAAAGTMRQLDARNVSGKPLEICFYDILATDGALPDSQEEALAHLRGWGLKTSELNRMGTVVDAEHYHRSLAERRDGLDFEIDGVVLKVDQRSLRERLGVRARSPRWAIAWKFAPREEVTTLEEIVVQVGRTGILTPVALLQPVDVGGVTVSRATLHNADEVARKDVRAGDRVRIYRAGDVIPEVRERIPQPGKKRSVPFAMPHSCPVCGTEVVREGAYFLCPAGLACAAQLIGRILHYASRDALDIDHLGEKTVRQLVERGMVRDLADIYRLARADFESLDGFAERSAGQLFDAIQSAKRPRLDRFLYGLGIRHVGSRTAKLIAGELRALDAVAAAAARDIEVIPEIGEEIAASVVRFFHEPKNRAVLRHLHEAGVDVRPMPSGPKEQPLAGKVFVFTGRLEGYTRVQASRRIEAMGGRVTSSVSGETDYLVVGEDPGSKLDAAREQEVEVLDEAGFRKRIGDS